MATVDARLQHRVLEALVDARNYNRWLAEIVGPVLGDDPVEVGSGIGTFAQLWLDLGVPRLTVTEIEAQALDILRERFAGDDRVRVERIDLASAPEADHSAVVAVNVLEHIEDDVGALRGAARLVRPGGTVALLVPAFPFAMSRFDRSIGHFRRYTAPTLRRAFSKAGLESSRVRYVNAPGLLAWYVGMRLLRLEPHNGPLVRSWDRCVVPLARAVERRIDPPFGQSVLGFARTAGR